jgi:predicted dehydrogenase
MPQKLVFVGATGHTHLVLGELADDARLGLVACAPSYPGEDITRLDVADARGERPRVYDDWRRMLDQVNPDIVVACGRHDTNGPVAIEAARRGCHIISEKPAGHTLDEVAELRRLVADGGLVYASMLVMRYEATFYTAHRLVRQGVIGEPYLVTAQKSYRWGTRPDWYGDRAAYGSTMTWVGIHAFDYARWVAGVEYSTVCAQHANLAHPERPGCQDTAAVVAELSNGGSALFNLDYLRPVAASSHGDDRLRVAGSEGVLEVCDAGTRLHVITADEDVPSWPLDAPGRSLLSDFVAAIEGAGSLLVPAEEAFSITEFAISATRAADERRMISLRA